MCIKCCIHITSYLCRDENARLFRETLAPGQFTNAKRDAVVLNAGMGLYVYGLAQTLGEAFKLARSTLEAGAAEQQLDRWVAASARAAGGAHASDADTGANGKETSAEQQKTAPSAAAAAVSAVLQ